ncbi:MAG: acetoacetate--CoA ligase, partial [Ketobacter sp.]|nr:acetoacetate--CoA ligase [Ketobacter sp.]
MSKCLWNPSSKQIGAANITSFREKVAQQENLQLPDYAALYQWSVKFPEKFWSAIWDQSEIIAQDKGE